MHAYGEQEPLEGRLREVSEVWIRMVALVFGEMEEGVLFAVVMADHEGK